MTSTAPLTTTERADFLAQRRAAAEGMRFVHPANEPLLIAGVATYTLEILEAVPDLDVLIASRGATSA